MSDCTCFFNSANKYYYEGGIICSCLLIFVFQTISIADIKNFIKSEEIESFFFSETPLYNLEPTELELGNKKNITFFEFLGRESKEENVTRKYDKKSFTKIFNHKLFYNKKDKNYFDYKNKYAIDSGNNCTEDYQKCGILDSSNRILCLPNNEDCPLNEFGLSLSASDSKYEGYESKEVIDSISGTIYYIYYTNNNSDGNIITKFKLSHGRPCASSSEKNWVKYYNNEVEKYGCKTKINGNLYSDRYIKVSEEGINITSLYKDNGLIDPSSYSDTQNQKVDIYIRNYNDIDQKCFEDFLQDLKNETIYYDFSQNIVKVIGGFSIALNAILFFYMVWMCKSETKFHYISLIISICGIICNILILVIINKKRIKYNCELAGFNEEIDELVNKQYDNNSFVIIFMSSISLALYIFSLISGLCLKFMRDRNIEHNATSVDSKESLQPAPVYSQVHPTSNEGDMVPPNYQDNMAIPLTTK